MKPTTLLLTASLVANLALIAFVATRPTDPAPGSPHATNSARATSAPTTAASPTAAAPSAEARDTAIGRALTRYQQRLQAARATSAGTDARWWRTNAASARNREEELAARRELTDALIAAFGDDLGLGGADRSSLNFLSPQKRAALLSIMQDYDEMMAKFGSGGIQLSSDKEKLRLLRAERDRDIAALLTPAELADYELRTSPSAATLRTRYGDAIASEDDFKKLYVLQKAFDEKFPAEAFTGRVTMEAMRARSDAQQQLQADMRTTVGDEKFAALRRANDSELRSLDSLVTRLGLPANTTDRVATARETYAAESQRINADTALSTTDRRAQLQALGTKAKTELAATLGNEVAEAFTPRASWVGMLQGGIAFSTTPVANSAGGLSLAGGPSQSVFPVMPAGTPGPGTPGVRQVVNVISSSSETTGSGGGTFILGGGAPVERPAGTMQVISVSSATHGETPPTTTTTPAPKP
jgi:hypothetical protein